MAYSGMTLTTLANSVVIYATIRCLARVQLQMTVGPVGMLVMTVAHVFNV